MPRLRRMFPREVDARARADTSGQPRCFELRRFLRQAVMPPRRHYAE